MSSDSEFLMRMGEARYRLEQLYYEQTAWEDYNEGNPFWEGKKGDRMDIIRQTLIKHKEELFEILMLMSPNKDK